MTAMSERRFKLERRSGSRTCRAVGVMTKGEDELWRYWIEFDGHCIPGLGEFPPTRAGHARLKACAWDQLEQLVRPPHRRGSHEDVQ
jgi:hypothetical protein